MKNTILKPFLLVCFLVLTACGSDGPEDATLNFLENMYAGNFEAAKEYATTDTKSMLTMMESFGVKDQFKDKMGEEDIDFEVIDTKIDGDKAVCTVKATGSKEDQDQDMPMSLVKKDGKWLVDMNKESMNKEGMDKMDKEDAKVDQEEPVLEED